MMRAFLRGCSLASVVVIATLCGCCSDCCDSGCGSNCSTASGSYYEDGSAIVMPSTTTAPSSTPAPNAEIIDLPPAVNTKAR